MANIKLTDNTWDTSGVYDSTQEKTQAEVNADVASSVSEQTKVAGATKYNTWTSGYIKLDGGVGDTVAISTIVSSANLSHMILDCEAGERFTIFGYGTNAGRLYGVVDNSNTLLLVASPKERREYFVLTIPANGAKLIINNSTASGDPLYPQYRGVVFHPRADDIIAKPLSKNVVPVWEDGGVDNTGQTSSSTNKRSQPISFQPGQVLKIQNTSSSIKFAVYGSKGDNFSIASGSYVEGEGIIQLDDWERVYWIRLAPISGSTRPNPASGGYITVTIENREIYPKSAYNYGTTSGVVGFERTYTDIKQTLDFEAKTIDANGDITPSTETVLVELPNTDWIEVRSMVQGIKFKVIKITSGTVTFIHDEWCYYTYRYNGDPESTYYALIAHTSETNISVPYARKSIGIFGYHDNGYSFGYKGYAINRKHIAFFGDSIVQGRYAKTGTDLDTTLTKPFGALIAENAADDDYGNYGIGGALVSGSEWKSMLTNCEKISAYDVVFVVGGVNDFIQNVSQETFTSAFTTVLNTLKSNNTQVVVCTPTHQTHKTSKNTLGFYLSDYCTMEKEVAASLNIDVIDINRLTGNGRFEQYWLPDNLHPNEMGHRIIADFIISEYDKLYAVY